MTMSQRAVKDQEGAMSISPPRTGGPLAAHFILVGSWVAPPFMLLGWGIAAGLPFGLAGVVAGTCVTVGLLVGPPSPVYRTALCAALSALAMAAEKGQRRWAVAAAAGVSILTFLVSRRKWHQQNTLYTFITETLRGRDYYAAAELRGALDKIRPGGTFYACHPHGCLSAGWTWNLFWNSDFHRRTGRIAFAVDPSLRSKNPLFRMVCDMYESDVRYVVAADKRSIKAAMKKGDCIALLPGGFEDATIMAFGLERTAISKRQGFVKYCLEEGYPIAPVYTFGEAETYWTFTGATSLRLWLNKYKIPGIIFWGRWWLPVLPRPVKLLTYVGEPLVLPKIESPSCDEVALWHGKYVAALQSTFDKYKTEAGKPTATLEIW